MTAVEPSPPSAQPAAAERLRGWPALRAHIGQRLVVWGLGIALGYGALEQGAYYGAQLTTVAAAVAVALVGWWLIGRRARQAMAPPLRWAAGCWLALAVWVLVSGQVAGDVAAARPMALVAAMLAAALVAVSGLSPDQRTTLHHVIVAAGLVVAVTAWAGVAWHRVPWALPSQSLWRGSATLTYANAAAAFLVAPGLLTARRLVAARSRLGAPLLTVLAVGWASTLSRGGALSLALGLVIALVLAGRARTPDGAGRERSVWRLARVVTGTALGFAALLPSMPEADQASPWLAAAGMVGGAVFSAALAGSTPPAWAHRRRAPATRRASKLVVALAIVIGAVAAASVVPGGLTRVTGSAFGGATADLVERRFGLDSQDRLDLQRVTWQAFARHPIFGVGPGRLDLRYVSSAGRPVRARYTHNEYLQLAAETGVPGVALASGGLVSLVWAFARRRPSRPMTRGFRLVGLGLVVTFALHSWLDFLWHLPAIPLLVLVTAGSLPNGDSESDPRLLRQGAAPHEDP